MNEREAAELLETELEKYRLQSYEELLRLRKQVDAYWIVGPSEVRYQIEVQAFWDSWRAGNLRVMGSIDGGGISALRPLSRDFIISPDGEFIGE